MTKTGVVKPGSTPSAVSGRPSQLIKSGEALRRGERPDPGPESLKGAIPLTTEELDGR
jgi:hypothetical protein